MSKITAKGAAIQLSISSVFTTIAQCDSIDAPDAEVETQDVTALDSNAGRENKPTGYVNGGKFSFSGFFDPVAATHQACTDLLLAPAVSSWKILWSDGATTEWPFSATLTKFKPAGKVGEFLKFEAEGQLDGLVTYPT